jgi:hypothetical protein
MDIQKFRKVLLSFADDASNIDLRPGRLIAQIRDEMFEVDLSLSEDASRHLLVTEYGQKTPARLWLLNRVAKLPQLADRIISKTTATPELAAKSPFVVPSGKYSPDISASRPVIDDVDAASTVDVLIQKASAPLPGATSVMYLTSDAGEGKTTIINEVARQQAILFKEKKTTSLVVPIPLNGRAFLTFDDAVIAALVNRYRFNYFYFDAFLELVKMNAIIPAFDGYEEMLVEGWKGEAVSALGNLVQTLDSDGTVFLAARKAFFEYLGFKSQAKLLDAIGNRSVSFSRLEISRWTKSHFCEYGLLRKIENPEEIYETFESRLGSEHPLLTRAVLVRRIFDVATNSDDRNRLADLLGSNPHDYFYMFVNAIIEREANEKWLSKVSGDLNEPLLTVQEHHELLSAIAQEMWQTSTTSIRYELLDVIVDIYCESSKKSPTVTRQVKERIKQHSLLTSDPSRNDALLFDHEDFHGFYLGEALGRLLSAGRADDLHAFLAVGTLSKPTIEQASHFIKRNEENIQETISKLCEINSAESGFSFCKENCSELVMRLSECLDRKHIALTLKLMFFSPDTLLARRLENINFEECHFQPTPISGRLLRGLSFLNCEFERLEIGKEAGSLSGLTFLNCKIDSLLVSDSEEYIFDPKQIEIRLQLSGAGLGTQQEIDLQAAPESDIRLKVMERFLRIFLRSTQVEEQVIRVRLGTASGVFFDDVLPSLLSSGVLGEVPWSARGVQHRYKLIVPMEVVSDALENSGGSFDDFLQEIDRASRA